MKALLYCTKSKPYLHKLMSFNEWFTDNDRYNNAVNGFIVAHCDIELEENWKLEESCLTVEQYNKYLGDKIGYALRISNLSEYYTMLDLSCFYKRKERNEKDIIDRAPQNMMYAYDWYNNEYVLISIQPKWLEKILNREKTIEIRKKVLNGLK